MSERQLDGIAIVGMSCRFPGADDVKAFWENLKNGVCSISFFDDEEVLAEGVDPKLLKQPDYVKAWGVIEDLDLFDAHYFGISAREAEAMDPQHRLFLETALTALEDAGYNPDQTDDYIGVYATASMNNYLVRNLSSNPERLESMDEVSVWVGNDKDFLATRTSFKLGLRGPSMALGTGCSSSFTAMHTAIKNLKTYDCDVALVGGANVKLPQKSGYLYRRGGINSPDGLCRAFDADASGTIFGNGVAAIVLKRLADAVADRDDIYAVIRASAINNDGDDKVAYTAPSVRGQEDVIAMALELAKTTPDEIGYVEAHGTGTELGDPIEFQALRRAFGETQEKQYCPLGTVKTNVGHLDSIAGMAGIIKTALSLRHESIPASLHYSKPNPEINFENSPFFVNTENRPWKRGERPRLAGVSSFGVGGTNVHTILEEAPLMPETDAAEDWQLLPLSAQSPKALDQMVSDLSDWLEAHPEANLADVSYTLAMGRRQLGERRVFLVKDREDALAALRDNRAYDTLDASQLPADIFPQLEGTTGDARKEILAQLAGFWLGGEQVFFAEMFPGPRGRLHLPTYPFQRKSYWIAPGKAEASSQESAPEQKAADLEDWFYLPSWERAAIPAASKLPNGVILFEDQKEVGVALHEHLLQHGVNVFMVRRGEHYNALAGGNYEINPNDGEDYIKLFKDIADIGVSVDSVCYLWPLDDEGEDVDASYGEGFRALLYLSRGLAAFTGDIQLLVSARGLFDILDGDTVNTHVLSMLGPLRVLPQEHRHVITALVELDQTTNIHRAAQQLCDELEHREERFVAWRGRRRFRQMVQEYPLPPADTKLEKGGTFLITGGLGGIGLSLATYLARETGGNLVLTNRSGMPSREEWDALLGDEKHGPRIKAIREMEGYGAQVLVVAADVSHREAMAALRDEVERTFGSINGVIHSAGSVDRGILLTKTDDEIKRVLGTKKGGAEVLSELFADSALDFMVYCSSLASWLGGLGQAAYCGANLFLDGLAAKEMEAHPQRLTVSINWDSWAEVGMAVNLELPEELRAWQADRLDRLGIRPNEGQDVFARVLKAGVPNVVISTHDFKKRLVDKNKPISTDLFKEFQEAKEVATYPRPELPTPYVSAESDGHRYVANIWKQVLGVDPIGIDDDFFDLGGDSLRGMHAVNQLEEDLGEPVHMEALFEASTVRKLFDYLCQHYTRIMRDKFGEEVSVEETASATPVISQTDLSKISQAIPIRKRRVGTRNNKPAVFILAPPRSGSTLLRVMMAGNPQLFAPPELLLMSYDTMGERAGAFNEQNRFWLEGAVQAVMEARGCSLEAAHEFVATCEAKDMAIADFYGDLQNSLGERLIVDKTPAYAYDMETMRAAEADFENAYFIHLQRHPHGMIRSYVRAKMDLQIRGYFDEGLSYSSQQIAEMIWLISHRNIETFLKDIPQERKTTLRFEDFVKEAEGEMTRLCEFLDVPYHQDMIHPYKEKKQRMTGGLHEDGKMLGDINFHGFNQIDPNVADSWRKDLEDDFLCEPTWELAKAMGYTLDGTQEVTEPETAGINVDALTLDEAEALLERIDELDEETLNAVLAKLQ